MNIARAINRPVATVVLADSFAGKVMVVCILFVVVFRVGVMAVE
jgi:hypothetical protein